VSAGGLRFNAVAASGGYLLGAGTLTLAAGSTIDIRNEASTAGANSRVRFSSTSIVAGSNITISNNVNGGAFASYATFSGNNTWGGNLTLTGNTTGLFVEATTPNALATLSSITVGSTSTLALAAGNYEVPTINMGGLGLGDRGSIRFDGGTVNLRSNVVLTENGRVSTNGSGIGIMHGVISGNFNLVVNSSTDAVNRIALMNTNTFAQLTVNRGNVQIGSGGTGTSGNGLTTMTSGTVSGTGRVKAGFQVFGGTISPGDNFGDDIGTLTVTGNLNFASVTVEQTVMKFTLGAGGLSDRVNVTGNVLLKAAGNLSVMFESGYTPTVGDSWTLLDWGVGLTQDDFSFGENFRTGADADGNEGDLLLDDLSGYGYKWNITTDTGALVVSIIPEPSVAMLSVLAAAGFAGRRRRPQA
jgi:fibronectin-binding autotransporter adhesin